MFSLYDRTVMHAYGEAPRSGPGSGARAADQALLMTGPRRPLRSTPHAPPIDVDYTGWWMSLVPPR